MNEQQPKHAIRVAIPTEGSGGLMAKSSEHFGRCPYFTVVEVAEGAPIKTLLVENPPHHECLGPVQLLVEQGVSAIIVQGIGLRPLAGFRSEGIEVYTGRGETVGSLVAEFASGRLVQMDESSVCSGGRHYDR
jgi:predicted Fe-Mo cluster-binding NifX family protein